MRCKPNDLAVFVNPHGSQYLSHIEGWIFELSELVLDAHPENGPCWNYKGPRRRHPLSGFEIDFLPDDHLQPLRDPGEDAVDETLLRLPAPKSTVTDNEEITA